MSSWRLIRDEFTGPIDIVIDDASHLYGPTKRSFETLFPELRPGGLYIIEDWAWAHWPSYWQTLASQKTSLSQLVVDLIAAVGTSRDWISRVTVFQGFAVIERGPATCADSADWKLADFTLTKPPRTLTRRALGKLSYYAKRAAIK